MKLHKLKNPYLLKHAFDYAAIGKGLVKLDGSIIKVNHSLGACLGYEEDELLSLPSRHFVHPEDLESLWNETASLLNGKTDSVQTEKRFIHKDHSEIWASLSITLAKNDQGQPLYFVCQLFDITDQKHAQKKLLDGEKRYKQIIDETPDAVLILRNQKCLFINEAGVQLIGAEHKDEVIGENVFNFIDRETKEKLIDKHVFTEAVGPLEGKVIRYGGEKVDIELKTIPTVYQEKQAVHAIIEDITERKRTQELMINTEKLTVAGQLAAGIAHEIKNPLTAIKGFLQIIENDLPDKKTYFNVISQEMNRIETILSELLILAKPQTVKFEQKKIAVILNHVMTLSKALPNLNNIIITENIESDLPKIFCDENQLKQVFINFVKNAVEAMPDGGEIHIEAKRGNHKTIIIRIIDQGHGIPEHLLGRVGEPFLTTKDKGTGLGLMISRQIIDSHNGKLQFNSSKEGTTVEVTLPYTE
ncbi:PAS domain S-box protein [Lentibacillus sp. Marseille-P4043]|uniref:PAS domain S-box protein n=1 Tax=Lentibacillus sp. Marseille-P4043 TaxID=2040293 RepID=UPI000D0AD531|nr:PAS domain S-box protein [Lentibacillus sp. Marseille-P4043]